MWKRLRNRAFNGFKFRRQHPIGNYIVDFICIEKKVILEFDGSQHLAYTQYDRNRAKYLRNKGYSVLRFWDNEVFENLEGVLLKIYEECL